MRSQATTVLYKSTGSSSVITYALLKGIKMHKIKASRVFHHLRMFRYTKVECAKSQCVKRVFESIHSRGSVSSVKRSARSATVSTAASDCFMAALLWLKVSFFFFKKQYLFISFESTVFTLNG